MVRISKDGQSRILNLVDVEGRKVAAVAAEYGCSTANIYIILGKMRRAFVEKASCPAPPSAAIAFAELRSKPRSPQPLRPEPEPMAYQVTAADTISESAVAAAYDGTGPEGIEREEIPAPAAPTAAAFDLSHKPHSQLPASSSVRRLATGAATAHLKAQTASPLYHGRTDLNLVKTPSGGNEIRQAGSGSSSSKSGFGLAMRTADGDESMTPFRSLDDLLAAIKPVLRAAARSSDAVWFSIQAIDLSTLEIDAA